MRPTPLYLAPGSKLSFDAPAAGDAAFDEYVSDPAKPVPFRARPIQPMGYERRAHLVASGSSTTSARPPAARTSWPSSPTSLTAPVKISGEPVANLVASTSGTDSDWVVKLIDVYPDEVAGQPALGGYQLMVSADIFRGRYRESLETAKPIAPDKPLLYRFALPTANHVFLPGHRIMVQVQSSWFPLYDRNPQTFVPNIFWAKPGDYRKATQRVYHAPGQAELRRAAARHPPEPPWHAECNRCERGGTRSGHVGRFVCAYLQRRWFSPVWRCPPSPRSKDRWSWTP